MTPIEATDMAVRILGRFQGPPADVWEEVLADVQPGVAGTALARLTREHDKRWLSVAEFLGMCRQVQPYDASNRPNLTPCVACSDSGWVEVTDDRRHTAWCDDHDTCHCHAFAPCRCREGSARAESSVWTEKHPRRNAA